MIVVVGEALVDLIPAGSGTLAPRTGGSPYNVAVALGRLDADVALLSRLSTDPFGEQLLRGLREAGVRTDLVQRGPEPTSLAVATLDSEGSAQYGFYLNGTADRLFADPGRIDGAQAISVGSLAWSLEPTASVVDVIVRRAVEAGQLVVLDPNVRTPPVSDAAAYRERFAAVLPSVSVLKLSVEDARWITGATSLADIKEAMRRWHDRGPSLVVLTMGENGLLALGPAGQWWTQPAPEVRVIDTVGAGDTVQAALLAWLQRNAALSVTELERLSADQWQAALRFAVQAAAITCTRPGAQPPSSQELTRSTL
ncbi:carbohydrate kinase [Pseudonocardiaceae bacterium YIM PH 21723]|nr:carbohydrate kinase [Pseudonocardiaceae bacterium YIM PH 21723]